jgi:hypothetical protein
MSKGAKIEGVEEVLKGLSAIEKKMHNAVHGGVVATAVQVQRTAILDINKQSKGKTYEFEFKTNKKTGNIFPSKKRSKPHIASKEGDAPNTDTGRLVGSVGISAIRNSLTAYVFSDVDYGAYLELINNRPWLRPALEANKKNLKKNIERQVARALA